MADNKKNQQGMDEGMQSDEQGSRRTGQDENSGNFANDPQRASEAGKKGGQQSRSGQNS